jgi:hypothetical protein
MRRFLIIAVICLAASVAWAAGTGEAHLVMQQLDDNTWTCTFETLYVQGTVAADFNAGGLHAQTPRASQAACITWAKAVVAALDAGNKIPAANKSWEAHSKKSTGEIE